MIVVTGSSRSSSPRSFIFLIFLKLSGCRSFPPAIGGEVYHCRLWRQHLEPDHDGGDYSVSVLARLFAEPLEKLLTNSAARLTTSSRSGGGDGEGDGEGEANRSPTESVLRNNEEKKANSVGAKPPFPASPAESRGRGGGPPTARNESLRHIIEAGGPGAEAMRASILRAAVHASRTGNHGGSFVGSDGKTYPYVGRAFSDWGNLKSCQQCKLNKQGVS
mmetsp:Transcript_18760/g.54198  ORF Transcript_18760/g.54198 Transcript_18760/m.54198 type:complete len:219 (-) Transcript_18760:557-1213(-)